MSILGPIFGNSHVLVWHIPGPSRGSYLRTMSLVWGLFVCNMGTWTLWGRDFSEVAKPNCVEDVTIDTLCLLWPEHYRGLNIYIYLPTLWFHVSDIATVSYTSVRPRNDFCNYVGLLVREMVQSMHSLPLREGRWLIVLLSL